MSEKARKSKKQSEKFIEAAREHGADEDEETFKRKLKDVATHKPRKNGDK